MKKKKMVYGADLPRLPQTDIYLNISQLRTGHYNLNIVDNSRIVKKTHFRKV